jgi:hypothetical protein
VSRGYVVVGVADIVTRNTTDELPHVVLLFVQGQMAIQGPDRA